MTYYTDEKRSSRESAISSVQMLPSVNAAPYSNMENAFKKQGLKKEAWASAEKLPNIVELTEQKRNK